VKGAGIEDAARDGVWASRQPVKGVTYSIITETPAGIFCGEKCEGATGVLRTSR